MRNDLGPAAVPPAASPRKDDQLESVISSEIKAPVRFSQARKNDGRTSHIADGTALVAVYDGRSHIGFVYCRDSNSHEGFDAGAKTLGSFPTEAAAAAAVWRHAHGQEPRQ
jgi:hypothetical protein